MYPNLDAELARSGLKRKDLAWLFKNRVATVSDKLNGRYPILIDEAFRIKETYFPDLSLDYLFYSDKQHLDCNEEQTEEVNTSG
jgi:hypothetical protein